MGKIKVLAMHPYGKLGNNWNHRLKRQFELMAEECDLLVLNERVSPIPGVNNEIKDRIRKSIRDFKPDVVYVVGYLLGAFVEFDKIVYDMGSFMSRNILIKDRGCDIEEMLNLTDREIVDSLRNSRMTDYYEKEKLALEKAKVIISWESRENDLIKKIFGKEIGKKIHPISMMFHRVPEPIPFEEKQNRIMAISTSWGDKEKNGGLLTNINKEIKISSIGNGGSWEKFMEHNKLMDELNKSKVLYCPYRAGGCGVVTEGLRLGCNVVVYDFYPFKAYINDDLIAIRKIEVRTLKKALEKYYPPKKQLPTIKEQMDKIIGVISKVVLE